ncbi:MAG: Flp family type IVb pilin [Rhodopseudomonas sp.]|nr:Flp family type IVb pilin [Rhodopseudomonas sp.]
MSTKIRKFLAARDGTTAIEYSLIAGGIAIALIGAISTFGSSLTTFWTNFAAALN